MSWPKILVGAAVVFVLLVVAPVVGLIALAVLLLAALASWLFSGDAAARPCPVCGEPVKNGVTVCGRCGHDFRAASARSSVP